MATTAAKLVLLLACIPGAALATRKMMAGQGVVQAAQDAAGSQSKWDYENAKTAWDVLCHNREAGVFTTAWKESNCPVNFFCHDISFRCDPDDRVKTISFSWGWFLKKTVDIPKTAEPVTKDGVAFRFFLESEGCNYGDGKSEEDCELPWETFDHYRPETKNVHVKRRFLLYDARKAGARALSVETHTYEATFYKSAHQELGTGSPLPQEPMFAGATGTGCAEGQTECGKPVQGTAPVPETSELDVTTNYLTELQDAPDVASIMTNRNWAKTTKTAVTEFELKK